MTSLRIASSVLALSAAFGSSSCVVIADGLVSVEGRAIVLDDQSAEPGDPLSNFDANDVEVQGYGAHLALSTPVVDVLGGVDRREYADEEANELTLGIRKRFLEFLRLHPYVEGNLRFTTDLETGVSEEDAFGWSAGAGVLVDITDSLFLNVRLVYETTEVDQAGGDTEIDGIVGTVGLGFNI